MATNQPNGRQSQAALWKLSALGFTMACEIIAGMFLGWLVDRWTGTDKVFLIIGTIIGIIVGMTSFLKTAMKATKASGSTVDRPGQDRKPPQ